MPTTRTLTLAKMDTPLHIHWSRPLPEGAMPTHGHRQSRYRWPLLRQHPAWKRRSRRCRPSTAQVGIDLGLHDVVVLDSGEKVGNPRFFAQDEQKLGARRSGVSPRNNWVPRTATRPAARSPVSMPALPTVARDFLHKLSTRIIRENQTICVESLRVKAMVKHPTLAKAIHDVGWGEFVRQLEYKAAWYGRTLVKIDRWYPSSKRCSACGHVLDSLPLDIRQWTCPACGRSP